jgi:exopolysaccharide biosynthesis predicted pyruvyltransferase EpsI
MRLLPIDKFADIFNPLAGKHVAVTDGLGNVGDRLIDAATRQLLKDFGLSWNTVNPFCDPIEADYVLLAGGGSMGAWRAATHRNAALASGVPCILLPQSFMDEDDTPFHRAYVREVASLQWRPDGILAPDLALGYDFPETDEPLYEQGLFLRCDGHSMFPAIPKVDPCAVCHTVNQYLAVAEKYEHIVTDRLHLAIIALGIGRRATLLPVSYHKNRSMWETWLKDLGCEWADRPEEWL